MAMLKSTQTRSLGIKDNHNHYTSLRLRFLIIITDLLMLTHAILGVLLTCMREKLMFSLSIFFILFMIPKSKPLADPGFPEGGF